jgi:hypothetical protein
LNNRGLSGILSRNLQRPWQANRQPAHPPYCSYYIFLDKLKDKIWGFAYGNFLKERFSRYSGKNGQIYRNLFETTGMWDYPSGCEFEKPE